MKSIVALLISLVVVAPLAAQEKSAQELLRDGLFEEEANGNPEKAEEAYRKLVERYDEERRYAGTALFRLAELARKRGAQDEAVALYRRVTGEFGGEEIAQRAGERLGEMGVAAGVQALAGGISAEEQAELERLAELERNSPDRLNGIDEEGMYPIHRAAASGWAKAAEFLIEQEVDVNVRSSTQFTPLHLAVIHGHLAVVDQLLTAGAQSGETVARKVENLPVPTQGIRSDEGGEFSPVLLAILYERQEVLKSLLKARAPAEVGYVGVARDQLSTMDSTGRYDYSTIHCDSLMLATYQGNEQALRLLTAGGANVSSRVTGPHGSRVAEAGHENTPLTMAVRFAPEFVPELLEAGAEVPQEHYHEKTILHWAVESGDPEVVRLIAPRMTTLEAGEMVKGEESETTALVRAVSLAAQKDAPAERMEVVRVLIANGAKAPARALREAAEGGSVALVMKLLETGAPVGGADDGLTALHVAANKEVAELLIEAGVDLDAQTVQGWTPLIRLMFREDFEERRELADFYIEQGADVSRLVEAVQPGSEETIESMTKVYAPRNAMVPYILERAVYPELLEEGATKVIVQGTWKAEVGDRERIKGTSAPTIPELAALLSDELGIHNAILESISLFRSGADGIQRIDRLEWTEFGKGKFPEVKWGDLVEFEPRRSGPQTISGRQLMAMTRETTITLKTGPWSEVVRFGGEENAPVDKPLSGVLYNSNSGIRLQDHFDDESGVLDLSRVTLKRGEAEPVVFDFRKGNEPEPIRLVDGDVVEVPLLPEVARLVGGDGGERESGSPAGQWKGVVIHFPDRPAEEEHYGTNDFIDLLWMARSFPGGRDLSRITVYQTGEVAGGKERARTVDLGALARKFPRYEWSKEKLEELNFTMGDGSLIVVPPRAEVSWRKRIRDGGVEDEVLDELISFVAENRQRPSFLPAGRRVRRLVPTPPSR